MGWIRDLQELRRGPGRSWLTEVTYRGSAAPTEPVVVIEAQQEPGIPIPPPGPDAGDEDVEAFIQGLCKRNPYA
jgi:hypothetical protein